MAILVTGAAGFVALNVIEHLLTAEREVVGLDRIALPPRAVRDFAALPGKLTMRSGSILSAGDLAACFACAPIEAVVHCAVITAGHERERTDPETVVAVNVQGAVTSLVAAHTAGVKRFVYPSSGAVYGQAAAETDRLDEDATRPAPATLYALTKHAAESILPRIAETTGVSLTAARLGVVYGPWEYATGVRDTLSPMLQVMACEAAGQEAVLGAAWRGDFTCSRDIAAGLVTLADQPHLPRVVYNLATGRTRSAVDWCEALARHRPGFRWRHANPGEPVTVDSHAGHDRGALRIDRITADTFYRPRFDFPEAVADLLQWRDGQSKLQEPR